MVAITSPGRQFAELQLVWLVTENAAGAAEFIETLLGEFASASPAMHAAVLTYINSGCSNASRAAKSLRAHRNTLLHRLEGAQQHLPGPLDRNLVAVAVALQTLRWRGPEFDRSAQVPVEE